MTREIDIYDFKIIKYNGYLGYCNQCDIKINKGERIFYVRINYDYHRFHLHCFQKEVKKYEKAFLELKRIFEENKEEIVAESI